MGIIDYQGQLVEKEKGWTIRLVNGYLPGKVWTTYLLLGAVFTLGGAYLFSLRKPRTGPA